MSLIWYQVSSETSTRLSSLRESGVDFRGLLLGTEALRFALFIDTYDDVCAVRQLSIPPTPIPAQVLQSARYLSRAKQVPQEPRLGVLSPASRVLSLENVGVGLMRLREAGQHGQIIMGSEL